MFADHEGWQEGWEGHGEFAGEATATDKTVQIHRQDLGGGHGRVARVRICRI